MKCPKCGADCAEGTKFCRICGTNLQAQTQSQNETPSNQADLPSPKMEQPVQEQAQATQGENKQESQAGQGQPQMAGQGQPNGFQYNGNQQNQQAPQGQPQMAGQNQPQMAGQGQPQQAGQGQPNGFQNNGNQQNNQQMPQGQPQMAGQNQQNPYQANGYQQQGQQMNATPKKPFKLPKFVIPVAIAAVVVIAAVVSFVVIGNNATDYKKTATKYVKAVETGDWDTAYDMLNLPSGEFITKDAFKSANADKGKKEIASIQADNKYHTATGDMTKQVVVDYTYKTGGSDSQNVTLEKKNSNYMLFFKQYQISSEDVVVKDIEVKVPVNTKLQINGVEVSDSYKTEGGKSSYSAKSYTYYKIPYLINGQNKFKVTGDLIDDLEKTVDVDYDEDNVYVSLDEVNVKESIVSAVKTQAQNDLKTITEAGINNKPFSDISSLCLSSAQSTLSSTYKNDVVNDFHSSFKDVTAISLSDVKVTVSKDDYEIDSDDGLPYIKVSLSYSMSGKYKYSFDGKEEDGTGKASNESITYKYDNGKWLISKMYLYYSIY